MGTPAYPDPETREDFNLMGRLFYEQDESLHLHWHQGVVDNDYRRTPGSLGTRTHDVWFHYFTDKDREEMSVKWVIYKLKGSA